MTQTIGILGVGHLAEALVVGLMAGPFPGTLLLSPRGEARSRRLARDHGLQRMQHNQDLVDRCEVVILSTRPADAGAALADLCFRPGQVLISVAAAVKLEALRIVAPVPQRVRAMPITAAQVRASATAVYPDHAAARALFELLGEVIPLDTEAGFDVACTNAAMYGWLFALCAQLMQWNQEQGLSAEQSRALVSGTFNAASTLLARHPQVSPEHFLEQLVTPGGVTEHGLYVLQRQHAMQPWWDACDAVLDRLDG